MGPMVKNTVTSIDMNNTVFAGSSAPLVGVRGAEVCYSIAKGEM